MSTFRKISLASTLFALVILMVHMIVPHHHNAEGGQICRDSFHDHHHTVAMDYGSCHDSCDQGEQDDQEKSLHNMAGIAYLAECCDDVKCGLSHLFTTSSWLGFNFEPLAMDYHSVLPEPHFIKVDNRFTVSVVPLQQEYIEYGVPLRAPPVVVQFS